MTSKVYLHLQRASFASEWLKRRRYIIFFTLTKKNQPEQNNRILFGKYWLEV